MLFRDRLERALERPARGPVAVLFIDLDRFKLVNDSLGHAVGDELVTHVGRALSAALRPGDTVARLGGDEFAMLLEDLRDASEATRVAARVQDALHAPFAVGGRDVFTTASIGIAVAPPDYPARASDLIRDADTAMYRAKSMGKAQAVVFDEAMHARAVALLGLETDLRRALERHELRVYYQPVVRLRSYEVCGYEALVRWAHPTRGTVSPATFVPLAEETGLIVPIGRWVLREAAREARTWMDAGLAHTVSVNLSARQLAQPSMVDEVAAVLAETGLPPDRLHVEITESVLIEGTTRVATALARLRTMGVRVSLDDFGTGYSSLSYLHRFPIDTLKIDKSFVDRVAESPQFVGTIAALAGHLGMDVIAEGVETEDQARRLDALHCERGQGHLFGRPVEHPEGVPCASATTR